MGNDKVILHDFLSVLHILPTLQQWLNAVSKFPLNDKKVTKFTIILNYITKYIQVYVRVKRTKWH